MTEVIERSGSGFTLRAPGSATTPAGMKSIEVDAEFPSGAVDDNVLMALLPTLTLTPGSTHVVRVFAMGGSPISFELATR